MIKLLTKICGEDGKRYIRTKNIVIMVNPSAEDIKKMERVIKTNYRVHIFVTSPYIFTEDFINELSYISDWAKYYIHIPRTLRDIKPIADEAIKHLKEYKSIRTILESKYVVFSTPSFRGKGNFPIVVNFSKNHMEVNLRLSAASYEDYFITMNKGGAVQTTPMLINPEMFKDQIIENFKRVTPELILKSFKDDNDIWDYINQNGEWSVKEE